MRSVSSIIVSLIGVFCVVFVASWFIIPAVCHGMYRLLRDLCYRIGRVYRSQIIEPWRNQKSVRAFRGREPRPASRRSKAQEVSEGRVVEQGTSMLLTKLPVEIRLCIYEMVILDGSTHWHITEYRNAPGDHFPSKQARNSLWSFRSNTARMLHASVASQIFLHSETHHYLTPHEVDRELLRCSDYFPQQNEPQQNGLGIIRTCRQIYLETIPILYGQYFSFQALLLLI